MKTFENVVKLAQKSYNYNCVGIECDECKYQSEPKTHDEDEIVKSIDLAFSDSNVSERNLPIVIYTKHVVLVTTCSSDL